eukprot:1325274-Amphidinium_carterae.2
MESLLNMMQSIQLGIRDLRQAQSSRGHSTHVGDITRSSAPMQRALPVPTHRCREHCHVTLQM